MRMPSIHEFVWLCCVVSTFLLIPASTDNISEASSSRACNQGLAKLPARSVPDIISSPNWPNSYENNEMCRWVILASDKHQVIKVKLLESDMYQGAVCFDDYLEVRDGFNSWSPTIKKWCGKRGGNEKMYTSTDSSVLVTFKTNKEGTGKGFQLQYYAMLKGQVKYKEVAFNGYNYGLFGLFVLLVAGLFVSLVGIFTVRLRSERKMADAIATREQAAMRRKLLLEHDPRKLSVLPPNTYTNQASTMLTEEDLD